MSDGTDTPRTDAFSNLPAADQSTYGIAAEWAEFARTLEREIERLSREKAEASILMLGGTYVTQEGKHVTMVKIHNIGTPYETLEDETGVNRYSRRLADMGRVTGTAHDYSDPCNIQRPICAIALRSLQSAAIQSSGEKV